MTTVATLLVRLKADPSNLIMGMGKAQFSLRGLLGIAAKVALAITAVSAAVVAMSLKLAVDFESAMAGVRKTVDATDAQFATLETGILDMSKRIPIAATEIAGVAEAAGQLGIAVDDIMLFTEEMLKLGVTTDLSAREGAIALARFTNVMGTPVEQIGNLVATLVGLGNNVAATEAEILNFAVRLSKTGAIVGLTEADVLGLSAGLTELGIRAELGSTAFSRVFAEMASAVATGEKQLDRFAAVAGMSAIEFGRVFKDNAVEAMVLFVEGLGDLKDADQNVFAFLDDLGLGAVRVRDSLLGAALGSTGLRDAIALANKEFEDGTAANIEFQLRLDTSASKFTIFKNKIVATGISIGDALLPVVLEDLDHLADWFDTNEDKIVSFFVGFGDAVARVVENTAKLVSDIVAISKFLASQGQKVSGGGGGAGGVPGAPAAGRIGITPFADVTGAFAATDIQEQAEATAAAFEKVLAASSDSQLVALSKRVGVEMSEAFRLLGEIADFVKQPTLEDFEGLTAKEIVQLKQDANKNARDSESILKGISINITRLGTNLRAIDIEQQVRLVRLTGITSTSDIDEINAFKNFLREGPAQSVAGGPAENASMTQEQQDRLDAAFGASAAAVDRLLAALEEFATFRMEQRVDAFFRSGATGVAKLETEFAKLDTAWEAILPGLRALGVEVPAEWRVMFDRIQTETIDGAKRIGGGISGLLGVLIARRMMAGERFGDTDPRASLTTREVSTGGGSGTVIQIEQLTIGEGAQTTTGEIAAGIADGVQRATMGVQAVGT